MTVVAVVVDVAVVEDYLFSINIIVSNPKLCSRSCTPRMSLFQWETAESVIFVVVRFPYVGRKIFGSFYATIDVFSPNALKYILLGNGRAIVRERESRFRPALVAKNWIFRT